MENTEAMAGLTRSYLELLDVNRDRENVQRVSWIHLRLRVHNPIAWKLIISGLPPSHFMVPYERNQLFVGRDSSLKNCTTYSRSIADQIPSISAGLLCWAWVEMGNLLYSQSSDTTISSISAVTRKSILDRYERIKKRANTFPSSQIQSRLSLQNKVILLLWLPPPFSPRVHCPHLRHPSPHPIPRIHPPNRLESQLKAVWQYSHISFVANCQKQK